VLGVFAPDIMDLMAATLAELGVTRAFVVHGAGGLDEISLPAKPLVAKVRAGEIRHYTVTPEDSALRARHRGIRGGSPAEMPQLCGAYLRVNWVPGGYCRHQFGGGLGSGRVAKFHGGRLSLRRTLSSRRREESLPS